MRSSAALLALALLTACGSTSSSSSQAPKSVVPQWTAVPPKVLEAVCARLRGEGIAREEAIRVITMTQPLIMPDSITALAELSAGHAHVNRQALQDVVPGPMPITITPLPGCRFVGIEHYQRARDSDHLVLQLSSPFANPFARGESGLFARLTIGDQAAQWYWVPLLARGEQVAVGTVMPLAIHEG